MSLSSLEIQADLRLRSAIERIPRGEWREAAIDLERAATLHRAAGQPEQEARCLGFAASLHRAAGDPQISESLAAKASNLLPKNAPLSVALQAERAESAFVQGNYAQAVRLTTDALGIAEDLSQDLYAALLRRRAAAYVWLGQGEAADADYDAAAERVAADLVPFLRIEQAKAWMEVGEPARVGQVLRLIPTDDPHVAAEVGVLKARLLRGEGKWDEAFQTAFRARSFALQAIAPVPYFAACVEQAEASRGLGDRVAAYRVLATCWVTLADLLGRDVARSWVEPILTAYQIAWGEEGFAAVKQAHDDARRREVTE